MATYKVIQDIEAEDKLIGWMTPRQAIYAAIVVVSAFICFMFATNGFWWAALPMLPHMVLFAVLAGPFVHDQPSEIWLLARIQFALKPRRRIWDQSGLKELVTITVPKKIERTLTDGLSQTEVKSRLQALANTIDSRGWAIKNVDMNLYTQPLYATENNDRLIDTSAFPQEVPSYDLYASDDVLDEQANPTAQHMQQMINQSSQTHRQQIVTQMQQPTQASAPQQNWFVDPASASGMSNQAIVDADAHAILDTIHTKQRKEKETNNLGHLRKIDTHPKPKAKKQVSSAEPKTAIQPAPKVDPVLVEQFARNDDLNVATIQRQVNKQEKDGTLGDNEVVISLH
jgi:hypothetical protein